MAAAKDCTLPQCPVSSNVPSLSVRVLATSPHCIEALRFRLIGLLTRDGNYPEASKRLEEFVRNVDRHEPHNPPFLLECARLFSRTVGGATGGQRGCG